MIKLIFEVPAHNGWGGPVRRRQKTVKVRKVLFDYDQENLFPGDHAYNVMFDVDTKNMVAYQYEPGADWIVPNDPTDPLGDGTWYQRFRIEAV